MIELRIRQRGIKCWYKQGQYHRDTGPAITDVDGYKAWYNYGNRHRVNGPAIRRHNGSVEYWINGKQLSEYEIMFINESCV